ncbi:hypothetical protein [Magnetospira sp. QH-2]|uniref:hypothetical protein n=1 Tax=Magnetospira sp. (strain QH-2) TaxID=1288970 RepID=UPI0003E819F9|nr:hypothetical protein [Magnetospira sp. QH-2]CCQ75486.1 conserved membrane protein of unknown function [Magnetospira sp. QH-2]
MLTVLFALSIALAPLYYWGAARYLPTLDSRAAVVKFGGFWVALYAVEYFILGPYSFIELSHEGNLNIALSHFIAQAPDGLRLTHEFGGGQDLYAILPGMQAINPEAWLFQILPSWLVILAHKASFAALGFVGAYLLARKGAEGDRAVSAAVAAIFILSHEYLINFSTNWGTGFAVMPLAVYTLTVRTRQPHFLKWVLVTTILVAAAEPIHLFPPLAVATIGAMILMPRVNLWRTLGAFVLFGLAAGLVWLEFIVATYDLLQVSTRGASDVDKTEILISGLHYLVTGASWVAFWLSVVGALVLLWRQSRQGILSLLSLVWLVGALGFVVLFPWDRVGLSFIGQLSHYYMLLAAHVLFIPILVMAARSLSASGLKVRLRPFALLLTVAAVLMVWNKTVNAMLLVWFGGQSQFTGYEGLKNPGWRPDEPFRVLPLFESPPGNVVAGFYGYESFDGQFSLNHADWEIYWSEIMGADPDYFLISRTGIDWDLWDGKTYDVDRFIDLDLLAKANVRYLFSALPLHSDVLRPVVEPGLDQSPRLPRSSFASPVEFGLYRLSRIFDPGELYVYEVPGVLPRIFAAETWSFTSDPVPSRANFDQHSAALERKQAVLAEDHRAAFEGLGVLGVVDTRQVDNGYDVTVHAPQGGVLMINNMYVPFWRAEAGGQALTMVPANTLHMALAVPPGAEAVTIRYDRPLVSERIGGLIQASSAPESPTD